MNKETGGPAFPSGMIDPSTPEDAIQSVHDGMTLRDYFAAKAMQAEVSEGIPSNREFQDAAAIYAYQMADAMLKARNQ